MLKDDNARAGYLLEEAAYGTACSKSIKLRKKCENGRETWFSLKDQHARVDKKKRELEKQEDFINQIK